MTKTTTFVLSVLLAATSPISSVSNTAGTASLYVAKHGSDSYSCSQAANPSTPKLTIGNALDCISPSPGAGANKIVEVAAGTYRESLLRGLSWPKGSSWNAPFILRAKAGDIVTVSPTSDDLISVNGESTGVAFYLVIQGFRFDGASTSAGANIFADYVRMIGNEWINSNQECNTILGGGEQGFGFEFINNKIHGGLFNCNGQGHGYAIYWAGSNALFDGNEIYDIPSYGFHLYRSNGCPQNITIRNNYIHDFGWAATCPGDSRCSGIGPYDASAGILTCGSGHKVYNNIVTDGRTQGINLYTDGNNQAYNNTVYNMGLSGIASNNSSGNIVRYNIVYNPRTTRDGDIFSWNAPDITTYASNLCARPGNGCSLVINPLFVDTANGNFNLQSGSPAAGIGAFP